MSAPDPTVPTQLPPPPPGWPAGSAAAGAPVVHRAAGLRRDSVGVALGVALLVGALVVSTTRTRSRGDLDVTVYLVGVGAVVALLGFGLLARLLVRARDTASELASWPLAFGAFGAGVVIADGLDDGSSTAYISGLVVIALAAGAYVLVPSAPPVVAGLFGLLAVYVQACLDVTDFEAAEDNAFKTFAIAVAIFVALVTAIAWFLPPARTTVAVVVGGGAVVAYTGVLLAIAVSALFFGGFSEFDDGPVETLSYDSDVYVTFVLAALLIAGWLVLGYLTDHPGFRILVVAMLATVFPAGLAVLAVEHPTAWGFGAGVLGAVVLGVVGLRAVTAARREVHPPGAGTQETFTRN